MHCTRLEAERDSDVPGRSAREQLASEESRRRPPPRPEGRLHAPRAAQRASHLRLPARARLASRSMRGPLPRLPKSALLVAALLAARQLAARQRASVDVSDCLRSVLCSTIATPRSTSCRSTGSRIARRTLRGQEERQTSAQLTRPGRYALSKARTLEIGRCSQARHSLMNC